MRALILVGATLLLAISCSPASTPTAAHTAVPSPSPRATASPSASPFALPRAATYGLLIVDSATGRRLEMITPDGRVGASAPIGLPALQTCIPGLRASLQPPVSATLRQDLLQGGRHQDPLPDAHRRIRRCDDGAGQHNHD